MRPPTKPLLVILKTESNFHAALLSPTNESKFKTILGKGPNEVIGILKDKGYDFGKLESDIPQWVINKIPHHFTVLYKAEIKTFPINL